MGRILQSIARSESGETIHAADAEKGGAFFCALCKDLLILKKSGKTRPGSKRPHFAHKALSPNCSPESAMHFEFKTMLAAEIESRIAAKRDLSISWTCTYCNGEHSGSLTKKARRVALEYSLGVCRPDITLFDENGREIAVVEIVVTHAPEEVVRDYYRLNGISLVELHLSPDEVLKDVSTKLANADYVQLCSDRKRCSLCGHFQQPVEMKIVDAKCYGCSSSMKVPFIEGDDSRGTHVGPDQFSRKELSLAREHGALIEWQYSQTLNTRYWAATCGRCRKFIGSHYLFIDYIVPSLYEGTGMTTVPLGNFCVYCEMARQIAS